NRCATQTRGDVARTQQCQQADAIEQQARDALIDRLVTPARQIEASDVQDAERTVAVLESMANTLVQAPPVPATTNDQRRADVRVGLQA
ncbi:hypothetical protein, partial [Xanthomonas oryzae]|uniref:hypothetical protein n=1 Tax=Xanthomonas oryzae TaxID=347 RepID=UPI000496F03B